jgi:hypothetical protein
VTLLVGFRKPIFKTVSGCDTILSLHKGSTSKATAAASAQASKVCFYSVIPGIKLSLQFSKIFIKFLQNWTPNIRHALRRKEGNIGSENDCHKRVNALMHSLLSGSKKSINYFLYII